jgi:hypothetical protein
MSFDCPVWTRRVHSSVACLLYGAIAALPSATLIVLASEQAVSAKAGHVRSAAADRSGTVNAATSRASSAPNQVAPNQAAPNQVAPNQIAQSPNLSQPPDSTRQLLEDARERLQLETLDQDVNPGSATDAFQNYRLGPGDSIFVNVLRFPDLTFQNTIDLEGNMLVPLVGALTLEGLTVTDWPSTAMWLIHRWM